MCAWAARRRRDWVWTSCLATGSFAIPSLSANCESSFERSSRSCSSSCAMTAATVRRREMGSVVPPRVVEVSQVERRDLKSSSSWVKDERRAAEAETGSLSSCHQSGVSGGAWNWREERTRRREWR